MKRPALFGKDIFGDTIKPPSRGPLADRFLGAPFSVLSARDGWWRTRKRAWLAMGIKSELGRVEYVMQETDAATTISRKLAPGGGGGGCWRGGPKTKNTKNFARTFGQDLMRGEHVLGMEGNQEEQTGTSVFDPVLCELVYRWFCPPAGQVVDPFAGGSVRGIVASTLGLHYWGSELRQAQVDANKEQVQDGPIVPAWHCGDALDLLPTAPPADLIFSCPPYGNLELYSDDPRDLSNMEYHTFIATLGRIILKCHKQLKDNRFAAFVVGEFRDAKGNYHNFVGDTIQAFKAADFHYYNEAILVTACGSLPVRITKQFEAGRKLGKTHQNLLIFVKGDAKQAAKDCGQIGDF